MKCQRWEREIALYVGNDLPSEQQERVQAHLAGCSDCRQLAGELAAMLGGLEDMGAELVDEKLLAEVRSGVLSHVGRPRRGPGRWRWLVPLTAAAAVAVVFWLGVNRRVEPLPAIALKAPSTPVQIATTAPVREHTTRKRTRARRVSQPQPVETEPLLARFETDDPDVVIYWIVDTKPTGD